MPSLSIGSSGDSVRALQQALIDQGFNLGTADGRFGAKTAEAVRQFQSRNGLTADGKVGPMTAAKLGLGDSFDTGGGSQRVTQGQRVQGDTFTGGGGVVAKLDRLPSGAGMTSGTITLNGRSYRFNSGTGSKLSTPAGEFVVKAHRPSRSDGPFTRNGVGFSFEIKDPNLSGDGVFDDPRRPNQRRTELRIHPDGGGAGTAGCIGLTGSAEELRQFRSDMTALINQNGGQVRLTVQA